VRILTIFGFSIKIETTAGLSTCIGFGFIRQPYFSIYQAHLYEMNILGNFLCVVEIDTN